jgi:6-pyruvoyltetrahydropterin/6-carboxytetrahydropterin synthase
MSFEVGVVTRFRATHHLVGDFGPASQPHSHDYRLEAIVVGERLQPDGTLLDITVLQNALSGTIAAIEGRDLNTLEDLAQPNPSAEAVARYICERMFASLSGVQALTVRVWESDDAFAAYTTSRR